ncbi:hypothetical protein PHISCL_03142 [Aspergillus sclerotialis]|uniref:Roadblock/LAMTOR2 domain-containing protein n=1 Tax=Aspergillus sclerotialis TaxID=2070753 RepID=A0A3A2ZYR0_9EURO|nr:hypothetical protein PHISCL_03142 [Aspergillus sclerotialis]
MASTQPTTQVPHHVNALLSHLTSRPGVQSTFILSRKDGSIIQSTGLFASSPPPSTSPSVSGEPTDPNPSHIPESQSKGVGTDSSDPSPTNVPLPESGASTPQPLSQGQSKKSTYQPSQAEALAARIFSFVTSATDLSASFANPPVTGKESGNVNGNANGSTPTLNGVREGEGTREEGDGEGSEKEDDADDVKLLRFRSKKHEVVVVPDRKYILCVVHDAASSVGAGGGGRNAR